MYSLKNRLTRNLIINMVIVMSVLLVVMYFSMRQLLQDYALTRLQHDAESLISVIEQDPDRRWRIDSTRISTVYDRVKSGHYYRIIVADQVIRSRSLFDENFALPTEAATLPGHYVTDGPWQQTWLVWHQQVEKNGQPIQIWVAEDISPIAQQLLQYFEYAVVLILIATILLIYLQQRTLRQSFQVFEWLRRNLTTIRHKAAEENGMPVPGEIMPLVDEIEKLVDQLRNRIIRTRHAIGNLAHELKRPLQILSLQQEKNGAEDSINALTEIKNIIERELRRAKISGSQSTGGDFKLAQEIPYLVEVMNRIYPQVLIEFKGEPGLETPGLDRDDMLELIGNLLDNACKFAKHQVRVRIADSSKTLQLTIEDDGEGIEAEQMESLTVRGARLDESAQGHGLGLGICTEILNSYHGNISFRRSALGGLCVYVEIPSNH